MLSRLLGHDGILEDVRGRDAGSQPLYRTGSSGSPFTILTTPIDIADQPSEADSASFEMRGRHSSVWPAALPPWTPEVVLDKMVESFRTRLRERIDDMRAAARYAKWDVDEREMAADFAAFPEVEFKGEDFTSSRGI